MRIVQRKRDILFGIVEGKKTFHRIYSRKAGIIEIGTVENYVKEAVTKSIRKAELKKMKSFRYKITAYPEKFEHPAGQLVRKALKYASAISVSVNDSLGDAKRILSIMSLRLMEGDEVLVEAEGPDEAKAVVELAEFFKDNL